MGLNLEKGSKNKKKKVEQPAVIMYVVIYTFQYTIYNFTLYSLKQPKVRFFDVIFFKINYSAK